MLIDQIRDLYINENLSCREISEKLGLSHWTILSKMRRAGIPRRSASEANAIVFSRKPSSYYTKTKLTIKEEYLRQAALMLYWAEGYKKSKCTVDFANCNVEMAHIFLLALRKIFRINERKLRILIYCYANQSTKALINFWSGKLNIPKNQFTKPYIRKDFNINNPHKMEHGLVHIRYSDKKLLEQIKAEIDIISKKLIIS